MPPKPTRTPERISLPGGWSFKHHNAFEYDYLLFRPNGEPQDYAGWTKEQAHAFAAAMNALQSPAGEWRPRKSAPKDGTHFWAVESETAYYMEVWWENQKLYGEGFYTYSDGLNCGGSDFAHFTHWMPLPPAPTGEG